MFFYVLIAVFVAGLMVGRTPEYLGKKIEAREIKLAALGALFVPTMVLVLTAISIVTDSGLASSSIRAPRLQRGALRLHSQANNNGSAFAGYGATNFSAELGTIALYLGPLCATASRRSRSAARSRRRSRCRPRRARSAPTAATFIVLLVGVIVLTAGLMIFPALTLGPIVEALS